MKLYSTVRAEASAEQIIEKSRFIAYVSPAETREEADEFIASIRKKHKDATHNVPAMVLGDKFQIQWGSDDGEPQGTSGAPIVQMSGGTGHHECRGCRDALFWRNQTRHGRSGACVHEQRKAWA